MFFVECFFSIVYLLCSINSSCFQSTFLNLSFIDPNSSKFNNTLILYYITICSHRRVCHHCEMFPRLSLMAIKWTHAANLMSFSFQTNFRHWRLIPTWAMIKYPNPKQYWLVKKYCCLYNIAYVTNQVVYVPIGTNEPSFINHIPVSWLHPHKPTVNDGWVPFPWKNACLMSISMKKMNVSFPWKNVSSLNALGCFKMVHSQVTIGACIRLGASILACARSLGNPGDAAEKWRFQGRCTGNHWSWMDFYTQWIFYCSSDICYL